MNRPLTEADLRVVVGSIQWLVTFVVVAAFMAIVLQLDVPEWLAVVSGWFVAVVGSGALVLGMALCWRLPDGRKWIALGVEIYVLIVGVLMLHHMVEVGRSESAGARRAAVMATPAYKSLEIQFNAAGGALSNQSAREFSESYRTAFKENEDAKGATSKALQDIADQMTAMLATAPAAEAPSTAFAFAGEQNAGWIELGAWLLLAFGYDLVAFALMYHRTGPALTAPQSRTAVSAGPAPQSTAPHAITAEVTALESAGDDAVAQIIAAIEALKGQGKPTGYRSVTDFLGWPETRVRKVMGLVKQKRENS